MLNTTHGCIVARHVPRILLSLVFLVGGIGFLMDFGNTVTSVERGLSPWGLAAVATLAAVVAILLKLGGSLMLLLNWKASLAAWMLIAFTVLATLLFHLDWSGPQGQMQLTSFLKNLGLIGGLLLFTDCLCKTCRGALKNESESM